MSKFVWRQTLYCCWKELQYNTVTLILYKFIESHTLLCTFQIFQYLIDFMLSIENQVKPWASKIAPQKIIQKCWVVYIKVFVHWLANKSRWMKVMQLQGNCIIFCSFTQITKKVKAKVNCLFCLIITITCWLASRINQ